MGEVAGRVLVWSDDGNTAAPIQTMKRNEDQVLRLCLSSTRPSLGPDNLFYRHQILVTKNYFCHDTSIRLLSHTRRSRSTICSRLLPPPPPLRRALPHHRNRPGSTKTKNMIRLTEMTVEHISAKLLTGRVEPSDPHPTLRSNPHTASIHRSGVWIFPPLKSAKKHKDEKQNPAHRNICRAYLREAAHRVGPTVWPSWHLPAKSPHGSDPSKWRVDLSPAKIG